MPEPTKTAFNWFGFNSLRQRYLATTILISFALIITSYLGWVYVENVSQRQLHHIEHRSSAEDALADLINQIHSIQINLQRYINVPVDKNKVLLKRSFQLYDTAYLRLVENPLLDADTALRDLLTSMQMDKTKLLNEVEQLIIVRQDETKWLPAMHVMQEDMLNSNMKFTSALDLVLTDYKKYLTSKHRIQTFSMLNDLRHSWLMMVSEFRLLISNSFGVFSSDPEAGVTSRNKNVRLYLERNDELLAAIEKRLNGSMRDEINIIALNEMRDARQQWMRGYDKVIALLGSEHWRQDMSLLENNIEPLIDRLKQRSSNFKFELGVASAKNTTELTSVAKSLSDFVVIIAIVFTGIGVVGYFVFHHSILKPIQNFVEALKLEAHDKHVDPNRVLVSQASEFRKLASAFEDMREQVKIRQSHLDHMAHHDSLTQLPNRTLLRDRLEQAIARSRRDNTMVALMFLDLDRFKQINDSLGHDMGDELLVLVAQRLMACIRSTDTVSRLGGDEFAVVLEGVSHADQVANMARKILGAFELPFRIAHHELHTTTSIGIALGPNDDKDVDALIKDADIAMYHAKDLGRNNFKFYSSEMAAEVAEHMVVENQLRSAMEEDRLFLLYQPVVDIMTGEIVSTEALLRWKHPEKGVLGPKHFLPILEDSGLIRPVTQWVLYEASKQYNQFRHAGFGDVRMAVNLSAVLLKGDSILDMVINTVEQTRVDPNGLIMEITEDTLLEDLQGSEKALRTLKEMGIRIALDDFGTGQSSLSHIRLESIDTVKIDRNFIKDIPENQSDADLVDAVIAMAHRLRKNVIAEGVETREQLEFLRWRKCDSVQGYFYSEPATGQEILSILKSGKLSVKSMN